MTYRLAALTLIAAVLIPLGVVAWRRDQGHTAERQQLISMMEGGDRRAFSAADGLARMPGGVRTLRNLLNDGERPADVRLIAGLELAEWLPDTPRDIVVQVEALIQPPGAMRERFVTIYADGHSVGWSPTIERWMLAALDDRDATIRLRALSALIQHSPASPRPSLCPAVERVSRDSDPRTRADAMLRVDACPGNRFAILQGGARDPDPAVRLAVLKRLERRLVDGLADTPADIATRLALVGSLVNDSDPAVRTAAAALHERLTSRPPQTVSLFARSPARVA